ALPCRAASRRETGDPGGEQGQAFTPSDLGGHGLRALGVWHVESQRNGTPALRLEGTKASQRDVMLKLELPVTGFGEARLDRLQRIHIHIDSCEREPENPLLRHCGPRG